MSEPSRFWRPNSRLTDREMEVLNALHEGKSLRDMSESMRVSQNTVKNHVRNIIEKLRFFSDPSS